MSLHLYVSVAIYITSWKLVFIDFVGQRWVAPAIQCRIMYALPVYDE